MRDLQDARVLVTGATGFLGHHVMQALEAAGADLYGVGSAQVDLYSPKEIAHLLATETTSTSLVVHLAYPGSKHGIATSVESPFTLASRAIEMDLNVIRACASHRVAKLLCVGSVCAYPETTTLPTDEGQLWAGYPEPVNAAYGLAKRTQLMLLQAARQEHGLNGIHLILSNMYGPGDRSGHVIPALIRRMRQAQRDGTDLVVWGRPEVTRSFLYVEDAAEGVVRALQGYEDPAPLNLVSWEETSMEGLVEALAGLLHFNGDVDFDSTKPTGHLRRCFSVERLREALGWHPCTPFSHGLAATVAWHLTQPLEA